MTLIEMQTDLALRNKKGIYFIISSIFIWAAILGVWLLPTDDILAKNLYTFFCVAPLMPLAFMISKVVKAEFSCKDNPLNQVGLLFSMNQVLYILIAMWAFNAYPERMVMILAMIFGAHLMPYGWLYLSKAYMALSVFIPLFILVIGANLGREQLYIVPLAMVVIEVIFAVWLAIENQGLQTKIETRSASHL